MTTSRLSGETLDQLSPLLGGIARMLAGGSQLNDRELRLLLMGAELDTDPDALNELRRWGWLLRELREEPTAEIRRATGEAFRARGLPDAPVLLAMAEVTKSSSSSPDPTSMPSFGTELKVTPSSLEWHDLAPGQTVMAELTVVGGPGTVVVDSNQIRVTPCQFTDRVTTVRVEIQPISGCMLWTTIRFVTSTQFAEVSVLAQWLSHGSSGQEKWRKQAIEQEVDITLEEAFGGTQRLVEVDGRRLEVGIPAGVQTGFRVRLAGDGAVDSSSNQTDEVYLVIKELPHPVFERDDEDLHCELPVDLFIALLGGEVRVSTLAGPVMLRVPASTQTGRVFRLAGRGMPKVNSPVCGDLYAKIRVALPDALSDREKQLVRDWAQLRAAKVG